MSKREELRESNKNIRQGIDQSFKTVKELVESESKLQERKMEAEAFDVLLDHASDEEVEGKYLNNLKYSRDDADRFTFIALDRIGKELQKMKS